ncbi:hypothetical protein B0J18DRAFT_421735, partial [Chaetomium sp. MPI-SDFR-AT-0129]
MMGGMCQMATFATIPSVPTAPLFPDSTTHVVPPTEHAMDSYTWGFPATSDNLLQELGDIDFRIHQARRGLLLPHCTPAPWSSSGVNEAFDAACSLVDVVDRFAAKRRMPSSDVHLAGIETALETSTRLMIHSCHEALLGIFEHLSASLLSHLSHPQHQQTPPRTPPHAAAFLPQQGNPQAAIVANSIRHLISQLDRAILSLSGTYYNTQPPQPHHQSEHETLSMANLMGHTSQVPGIPVTYGGGDESWLGNNVTGNPLFNEMEQRQARVGGQIKTVERLLRQPIV